MDYRNNLKRFIEQVGDIPIDLVTKEQILDFFAFLKDYTFDPSHAGKEHSRRLSPKTIANAHTCLSSF